MTRRNLVLRHRNGPPRQRNRLIILPGGRFGPEMKAAFILITIRNFKFHGVFQPGNGQLGDRFDRRQDHTSRLEPSCVVIEKLFEQHHGRGIAGNVPSKKNYGTMGPWDHGTTDHGTTNHEPRTMGQGIPSNPNGIVSSSPGLALARRSQAKVEVCEPTRGQRATDFSTATRLWPFRLPRAVRPWPRPRCG